MDAITSAVRELYEAFPYPSGAPNLRIASNARTLLASGTLPRPSGGAIRVLDAGCGRGIGTLGCATLQPDVQFLGVDINRVALAEATAAANARGLTNVRFQEVDLMTLDQLEAPDAGFDVVLSSGVIHHLSDPAHGLGKLREVLAPHGVLSLMVYGKLGREPIRRVSAAVDAILPENEPVQSALVMARELVLALVDETDPGCPFLAAARTNDVEFVDRYLHVQETSYDVDGLFDLIEASGFEFLRWAELDKWSAFELPDGPLRERIATLEDRERFRLIEEICQPARHEVLLARPGNAPRPLPTPDDFRMTLFAVHPEVSFESSVRNLHAASRIESIAVKRRADEPLPLLAGPFGHAGRILMEQNIPFRGAELLRGLQERGVDATDALCVVHELVQREILYCPHPVDVLADARLGAEGDPKAVGEVEAGAAC